MRDPLAACLEFEIFGSCARDIRIEIDAIRHFGHQRFGEASREPVVVVFENHAIGVAARVCGVVVRAVVVHSPVQELQVAIGAPGVEVEEVGHAEFADAKLDSPRRNRRGEMKLVAVGFDAFAGKRNDLAQHQPRHVGILAESRVAHDVEVGDAGEAEGIAETVSARAFDIKKNFRRRR